MLKISIVIPVDREEFLMETLDSIYNQTFKDYEVILIFNGEMLDKDFFYDKLKLKILKSEKHHIVDALNIGLDNAKGKYIARIDVGDIWHPNHLEILFNYLEDNKDCCLVSSLAIPFSDFKDIKFHKFNKIKGFKNRETSEECFERLTVYNWVNHPGVLYKNSEIRYQKTIDKAEDYVYWITIANKKNLACLNINTLYYNISDKKTQMLLEEIILLHHTKIEKRKKIVKLIKETHLLSNELLSQYRKKYKR